MDSLLWDIQAGSRAPFGATVFTVLFFTFLLCWDYPLLLCFFLLRRAVGWTLPATGGPSSGALPALLTVIPSLLRKREELTSMQSTVESIVANGYPGPLTVVISIDGTEDAPALSAELLAWAASRDFGPRTRLHVTGTTRRRSKPMAIDHGMEFVKALVARGELAAFPPIYVSTDADADLGPHALEAIVRRLLRRNPLTGAPARVVAGALHVRGNGYWKGWRHFFSTEGQLNLQVAREYYVGNIWRHNIRALPITGVPGAFYCTWSEIYLALPGFMGYLRTLKARHWLRWWLGEAPPAFSASTAAPLPELVAGDTDDTVTAYAATIAHYHDGHFGFDPPRTPLHALGAMVRTLLLDRPLKFEPSAHVYTSSPTTITSLLKQRRRWNTSRIELTGRFFRGLAFHWSLGLPVFIVKALLARSVLLGAFIYFYLPIAVGGGHLLAGFLFGYACQVVVYAVLTASALTMNWEPRHWRILLALPVAPAYNFFFNWLPGAFGATCDVLLFGNFTGFTPEWTLKRGQSTRIALLFRLRRAFLLAVRSALCGDVPLGAFWLGWSETEWTPSGYEGWTTGARPPPIVPPPSRWFRPRSPP